MLLGRGLDRFYVALHHVTLFFNLTLHQVLVHRVHPLVMIACAETCLLDTSITRLSLQCWDV